jgi:3'-phosphoadenosine 5'-phosphosulfate sulfotransferase (PAPS reductase)/FAD synthetase
LTPYLSGPPALRRRADSPSKTGPARGHVPQFKAESIHIIREVAAEFEKPVVRYLIGKDSSVVRG